MKLKNTTEWSDHLLRRMVAWCCKQVGLPARTVRRAEFGKRSSRAYNGRAWSHGRIRTVIGPPSAFPTAPDRRPGLEGEVFHDQLEALVAVTAHECIHLTQFEGRTIRQLKRDRRCERATRWHERQVLIAFRANRDALLAEWNESPAKQEKPQASVQDRRAAKAIADLDRWQRKLKLVQTKVRKAKQRVAYYEKALAAKRGQ